MYIFLFGEWSLSMLPDVMSWADFLHYPLLPWCAASPQALRNGAGCLWTEISEMMSSQTNFSSSKIVLVRSLATAGKSCLKHQASLKVRSEQEPWWQTIQHPIGEKWAATKFSLRIKQAALKPVLLLPGGRWSSTAWQETDLRKSIRSLEICMFSYIPLHFSCKND